MTDFRRIAMWCCWVCVPAVCQAAVFPGLGPKGTLQSVQVETAGLPQLIGRNARKQLVVTGVYSSGQRHDLTHEVQYAVDKPNLVSVNAEGFVTPLADGAVNITCISPPRSALSAGPVPLKEIRTILTPAMDLNSSAAR